MNCTIRYVLRLFWTSKLNILFKRKTCQWKWPNPSLSIYSQSWRWHHWEDIQQTSFCISSSSNQDTQKYWTTHPIPLWVSAYMIWLLSIVMCMLYWPIWSTVRMPKVQTWLLQGWQRDTPFLFWISSPHSPPSCNGFKSILCTENAVLLKSPMRSNEVNWYFWWHTIHLIVGGVHYHWQWRTSHVFFFRSLWHHTWLVFWWFLPLQALHKDIMATCFIQLQPPSHQVVPQEEYHFLGKYTLPKKTLWHGFILVASGPRTSTTQNQYLCIWHHSKCCVSSPCLFNHCFWWYPCCFDDNAYERTQCNSSMLHVWDPRCPYSILFSNNKLCSPALWPVSWLQWLMWPICTSLVRSQVISGTGGEGSIHTCWCRVWMACNWVLYQSIAATQCLTFPFLSDFIPIWLYASHLGQPYPQSYSALDWQIQGPWPWWRRICAGTNGMGCPWWGHFRGWKNNPCCIWFLGSEHCIREGSDDCRNIFNLDAIPCPCPPERPLSKSMLLQTFQRTGLTPDALSSIWNHTRWSQRSRNWFSGLG